MLRRLEAPFEGTGFQIQRHQRVAELLGIAAGIAFNAQLVRRSVTKRHVHEAIFQVGAQGAPGNWRILRIGGVSRNRLSVFRVSRIKVPHQATGSGIVSADDAGRITAVEAVIHHRTPDNHQIAGDQRCRSLHQRVRAHGAHIGMQIDHAVVAEVGTQLAGIGIQRDQFGIVAGVIDTLAADSWAGRASVCLGLLAAVVIAHAATGLVLLQIRSLFLRLIFPLQRPGFRVQRVNFIVRRTEIDGVIDLQRRRFKGIFGSIIAGAQIAGVIGPGHLQVANVIAGDLLEVGEAQAIAGAAVG